MKTGVPRSALFMKAGEQLPGSPALLLRRQPQDQPLVLLEGLEGIGEMNQTGPVAGSGHISR